MRRPCSELPYSSSDHACAGLPCPGVRSGGLARDSGPLRASPERHAHGIAARSLGTLAVGLAGMPCQGGRAGLCRTAEAHTQACCSPPSQRGRAARDSGPLSAGPEPIAHGMRIPPPIR
ncbi:hypothetical protein COCNU_scaffold020791G000010 [Cocos nucifera]|nr:hypothetical protein [Cocos nucifera]